MITLTELVTYLNEKLQASSFSDFTSNGLQVEGKAHICKSATAVTASLKTIQEAVKEGVDVLIVHHGLFWKGDEWPVVGAKKEKLKLLLDHGISLLCYHLPLDAHQEFGNNWGAAQEMGWAHLESFGDFNGKKIGVKGTFARCPVTHFQKRLEEYYQHQAHVAYGGKEFVETVALISGGAYRAITDAIKEGVDCFVTGNFDEPAWHHAFEGKIHFFALGHAATERIGPRALGKHIQDYFRIENIFLDIENPF